MGISEILFILSSLRQSVKLLPTKPVLEQLPSVVCPEMPLFVPCLSNYTYFGLPEMGVCYDKIVPDNSQNWKLSLSSAI